MQNGDTVLHCAAKNRRFVELKAMIEAGGNPFIRNQHRQTTETLIKEIPSQSSNMVAEILAKIEELKNEAPEENDESWVHEAARASDLTRLRLYHIIGAPMHSYNAKGQTPKDLAEELGFSDIVQFLQEKCLDVESTCL